MQYINQFKGRKNNKHVLKDKWELCKQKKYIVYKRNYMDNIYSIFQ